LQRWSAHHELPLTAAQLLDELNRRIDDPDFRIGPSYFMRSTDTDAFSASRLERLWTSDIVPLLEEHYYGRWSSVASRFALSSLMSTIAKTSTGSQEGSPAPAGGGEDPNESRSLPTSTAEHDGAD
ncbi:MAG TPA: hypothetical protein VGS21_02365, partial [Acidimicrobiales bacterium]|nr:hypothetical protein [Acidimicrobiales bacterium]